MMNVETEDLGLSLSLGFAQNQPSLHLNLIKPTSSDLHEFPWIQTFVSSPDHENPQIVGGIDVNRVPSKENSEEEAGVSSPNSTISSFISRKRNDHRVSSDEEDGGETSRKKLRLSKDQSAVLEDIFKEHNTLNPKQKQGLAKQLGLTPRQVEVWFQNRRARTKLKQTEVDCEYLKRCVDKLTEDNKRLEKEVAELRALKLSPHVPTTARIMSMCPSCERVATSSSNNALSSKVVGDHHDHWAFTLKPWFAGACPLQVRRPLS